ncbi:MAG: PTS transporter subunit EIIC [Bacteroidales bacterium]
MYKKFHKFEMPKVLGFFSGTRFVPIITFLTVPI